MNAHVLKALTKNLADRLFLNHRHDLMDSTFWYGNKPSTKSLSYRSLLVPGSASTMERDACKNAAEIIVNELCARDAIWDFSTRQQAQAGLWSGQLCRGLGRVGDGYIAGPWWFEPELIRRWERFYMKEMPSKRQDKVMEAIRPMLAISKEWNNLLRLVTMTPGGAGLPVITGQGRPKGPSEKKHTEWKNANPKDRGAEVLLIGGFQQVFVPFVPLSIVGPFT